MNKITIYMAISIDGFICDADNKTPWSDAEWEEYNTNLSQHSGLIIGRRTYEEMQKFDEFTRLNHPKVIVVTSETISNQNIKTVKTPEEAVEQATQDGWSSAIIGGGQKLNSYFLEKGIATHLHVDIEPIVLKDGLSLFGKSPHHSRFNLINHKILSSGTIAADYEVLERPD